MDPHTTCSRQLCPPPLTPELTSAQGICCALDCSYQVVGQSPAPCVAGLAVRVFARWLRVNESREGSHLTGLESVRQKASLFAA